MSASSAPVAAGGVFGLGLARRMQTRPLETMVDLARTHGDICYLPMGPVRGYLVNDPELAGEVLVTKSRRFRKLPHAAEVLRQVDGNGLVISEGELWARQRRLMQPAFQPRRMAVYADSVVAVAERVVSSWAPGSQMDMDAEMTMLACRVVSKILFDVDVEGDVVRLHDAIHTLGVILAKELRLPILPPDWLPLPGRRAKKQAIEFLDTTVRRIIRERRASGADKGDLLSILLAAADREGDQTGMSDEQARDEVITLFNAGHDSTAACLTWILFVLSTTPEVETRLREEVEAVLGDRPATYADLERLTFTGMVVKETLRLYPPTWSLIPRVAVDDVRLGAYPVKKGNWVYIVPYTMHRNERLFPEPDRFDPERFSPVRAGRIPRYAYLPFGAGPHVCIGNALALMEMTLITATVVRRCRLELACPAAAVRPVPLVSLRPEGGLPMRVLRRS